MLTTIALIACMLSQQRELSIQLEPTFSNTISIFNIISFLISLSYTMFHTAAVFLLKPAAYIDWLIDWLIDWFIDHYQ